MSEMSPQQLSPNTRKALEVLVQLIRKGSIPEEFDIIWAIGGAAVLTPEKRFLTIKQPNIQPLHIDALQDTGLLFSRPTIHDGREVQRHCFITPEGYSSIDSGFSSPVRDAHAGAPVEIAESLSSFREPIPIR